MTEKQFLKKIEGTQFLADFQKDLNINGANSSKAMWNLITSKRDVALFSKGIKIHRNFRLKDVKWYFGIKGGADKMLEQLQAYLDFLHPEDTDTQS